MNRPYLHPRKKYSIKKVNNFICNKCKKKKPSEELEIDHVVPVSEGGTNDPSNLHPICIECYKSKTIEEWSDYNSEKDNGMTPLEKLSKIKEFMIESKESSLYETQFLILNHPLLSQFEYTSTVLRELFTKYTGRKRHRGPQGKYKEQRNKLIRVLRKKNKLTYEQLSKLLDDGDFKISQAQIGQICSNKNEKAYS